MTGDDHIPVCDECLSRVVFLMADNGMEEKTHRYVAAILHIMLFTPLACPP